MELGLFTHSVYINHSAYIVSPKLTALHVLTMDYVIAIYPLLLILVTYLFVMLHDRYRIVIWLWSPFHRCLTYFRKEYVAHT